MEKTTEDLVIRYRDGIVIIRLKAANLTNVLDLNRISQDITGLIDAGNRRIVLDLKNVRYAGSAALGMLLTIANRIKEVSGKLVLSHPEHVEELLRVSRTARLFTVAPDPKAAIALIEGSA